MCVSFASEGRVQFIIKILYRPKTVGVLLKAASCCRRSQSRARDVECVQTSTASCPAGPADSAARTAVACPRPRSAAAATQGQHAAGLLRSDFCSCMRPRRLRISCSWRPRTRTGIQVVLPQRAPRPRVAAAAGRAQASKRTLTRGAGRMPVPFPCPFLMGGVAPGQDLSIPSSQSVPAVRFTCLVCSCDLPPSSRSRSRSSSS